MSVAYINIGSNQGHRHSNIERAVALIEHQCRATARRAPAVESEPWGFDSPNPFINVGLSIETDLEPQELLRQLLAIEQSISATSHRNADGSYADRLIDIDLIAMTRPDGSDYMVNTPELMLPHPRMHLRAFVLTPMAVLAPEWRHPTLHSTAAELLAKL